VFKKILYPTDFSDYSEKALKYVVQLKKAGTEEAKPFTFCVVF